MIKKKQAEEKKPVESEDESYGSGRMTAYGYVVEWRLKPESAALDGMFGFGFAQRDKWSKGPYSVAELSRLASDVASKLVRPYIRKQDERIADHGLLREDAAIAVLACLKTSIEQKFLDHLEWRITRVELQSSYKLTRSEDNKEQEQHSNELQDMIADARSKF